MSLVVAHQLANGISIVSETKLSDTERTDPRARRRRYHEGALKAVLLNRWLCVGWVGNAYLAHESMAALALDAAADCVPEQVENALLFHHRRQREKVDYIIASLKPLYLSKISGGCLERSLTAWIGDLDAFEAFQRRYHAINPGRGVRQHESRMREALQSIIDNDSIPSVGQFVIAVRPTRRGFVYPEYMSMTTERPQHIPANTNVQILFGRAAEGVFSYSVLTPRKPGVGAIGIHFREPSMGSLFYPAKLDRSDIIRGVNVDEFVEEILRKYQVHIDGIRLH